jgi:hypothetical protein
VTSLTLLHGSYCQKSYGFAIDFWEAGPAESRVSLSAEWINGVAIDFWEAEPAKK